MTTEADQSALDALEILQEFGQAATLSRLSDIPGAKAYHKATGQTDYAVWVYAAEFAAREIDGTTILTGDSRYLMAASGLSVTPEPGDILTVDGQDWRVQSVQTTKENATAVLYTVHVRK